MPARSYSHLLSTFCLILPALLACGGKTDTPVTHPVTGVVTLKGAPVDGALVQFHPTNADYTPLAAGATAVGGQANTAADGSYTVESTFDKGKTSVRGLPAGAYKVTVVKMDAAGPASFDRPPKNVLDPRYAMVDSTPVKVTIKPDAENNVDIPL